MDKIDMIKAFAELEGVDTVEYEGCMVKKELFNEVVNTIGSGRIRKILHGAFIRSASYNPITDLALNCAARDKYFVTIEHYTELDCGIDGSQSYEVDCCHVYLNSNTVDSIVSLRNLVIEEIPEAVIKCILKSKGKWEE